MNALNEIIGYLAETALNLALVAVLLRFLLQAVRADFYNPISQFLARITNPLVLPLRRVIPSIAGLDTASLLLALLIQVLAIVVLLLLNGLGLPNPFRLLGWGVLGLAGLLLNIYFFALLAMIILSWVAPQSRHPALLLLFQLTEPVMAPFRRLLPNMGGLDFSPILVFILINVLQIVLRNMAAATGLHPALVIGL
ncbi:YggT family protein [Kineobactrum sediminis]|uniref:YggT family protein n=1 Tax=Kineobactrum sediminis TaxID=1905677 RepID=A0A2N5Y535_9GAMM|nr:YggT family protein [Kineobactrum sediminis]PLW83513.1 YggT family protein [Kineobactrum sediminis]